MSGNAPDSGLPSDQPLLPLGAQRWRGAERAAPEDLVVTCCESCAQTWLVHRDLSGFRIRCRCQAMIQVPVVAAPALLAVPAPLALARPLARRHRPDDPMATPERSVASRVRGVNRIYIQMMLILAAILGPQLVVILHHAGPDALKWWPFAGLASGVLVTLVGLLWPHTTFSGLRRPAASDVVLAVAVGVGCAEAALVYIWLLGSYGGLYDLRSGLGLPAMLFTLAVCPAVVEELAFRGLVQGSLTELWGRYLGWAMTAGIFALCHGPTLGLPCQFSLGLLLGWMRIRSGSLIPGMAMHGCYNGILVWAAYH